MAEVEHPLERIETDSYPTTPEESDSEAGRSEKGMEPTKHSPAPLPPIQEVRNTSPSHLAVRHLHMF